MNRILVICLLFAVAFGLTAAIAAIFAGWGWLAAFLIYSASGSVSLVSAAWVARRREPAAVAIPHGPVRRREGDRAYA